MPELTFGSLSPEYLRLSDLFQAAHGQMEFSGDGSTTNAFIGNEDGTWVRYFGTGSSTPLDFRLTSLRYGASSDPAIKWEYSVGDFLLIGDLEAFHEGGESSAATILAQNDEINGGITANYLEGYAGRDILNGGGGDDILWGGIGRDRLVGGSDADVFDFNDLKESRRSANARDLIKDFERSEQDIIDLFDIDANSRKGGDQAFKFIGDSKFHQKAGELALSKEKGDAFVYGDVNGDGRADFAIQFAGNLNLRGSDFVL